MSERSLTLLFGTTIFLSASLLFMVQPLFAKIILPTLGGATAVWVTLMFVYQGLLLLGYGYAHGLSHWLPRFAQLPLHLLLLGGSFYWLPLATRALLDPPAQAMPLGWLMTTALVGVGAPFFILSATSPLLQHWFTRLPHKSRENPYFLYAISNIGSLGALLGYPLIMERFLPLQWQSGLWFWGYVLFGGLLASCAFMTHKSKTAAPPPLTSQKAPQSKTLWGQKLSWLALSLVPSSLLLGVTSYITTQITSLPLLWVVPLALYLGTFIIAFQTNPIIKPNHSRLGASIGLGGILLLAASQNQYQTFTLVWHLITFFFITLALHQALAAKKPAASNLTGFYFIMSLGGVLGGSINAVLAPLFLDNVYEYPLMIFAAALLLIPYQKRVFEEVYASERLAKGLARALDVFLPVGLFALLWLPGKTFNMAGYNIQMAQILEPAFVILLLVAFIFFSLKRPFRLGFAAMLVLMGGLTTGAFNPDHILTKRSFFGTYSVFFNEHSLSHDLISQGSSARQGSQSLEPEKALDTNFFYNFSGLQKHLPEALFSQPWASAGLGVGTIACLSPLHNKMTFIEIDPLVVDIARDSGNFTYLKDCLGQNSVIVGDGRRMLKESFNPQSLGMIFLDTFSGASIPTHMLTKEAFRMYLSKLMPSGILAINITNLHIDLQPLIARQAADLNLVGLSIGFTKQHQSQWVILARSKKHLGTLEQSPDWHALPPPPKHLKPWTDSFASILPLL